MYLFELWFSLGICAGVGLLDHIVALFLVFKEASILLHQFTLSQTVMEVSLFPTSSPAFIICRFFDSSDYDQHEMIPDCGFDLHFS